MYYLLLKEDNNKIKIIDHHTDRLMLEQSALSFAEKFIISQGVTDSTDINQSYYIQTDIDGNIVIYHNSVNKGYLYNTKEQCHIQTYEIISYTMEKPDIFVNNIINKKKQLLTPIITINNDDKQKVVNIFDELRNNTYFQKLRINVEL